jgi:hypothetical protein
MRTAVITVLVFGLATAYATPSYKCPAKSLIKEAMMGKRGKYEVKQGLSVSKRDGFLERKAVKPTSGCFFGNMSSGDCVVVHFDKAALEKLSPRGQCVFSDTSKPAGAVFLTGRAVELHEILLKCPGASGYKCTDDDNNSRSLALEKELKEKGLKAWSFCAPPCSQQVRRDEGQEDLLPALGPEDGPGSLRDRVHRQAGQLSLHLLVIFAREELEVLGLA